MVNLNTSRILEIALSSNRNFMQGSLKVAAIFVSTSILLLCSSKVGHAQQTAAPQKASTSISYADQAIKDLTSINQALQQYHKENNSYPSTDSKWTSKRGCYGQASDAWIDGLAPKYIPSIPTDPRNNPNCGLQYLYFSNGKDYKLIAHYPDDLAYVAKLKPELTDPNRRDHAFGFWSPAAEKW